MQCVRIDEVSHVKAFLVKMMFHRYGRDILRSEPDGVQQNNLDNLPTF